MNSSAMKPLTKDRQKKASSDASFIPSVNPREIIVRTPQRIAILDSRGSIVAVNKEWLDLAERTRAPLNRVGPGVNYLEICRSTSRSSIDARKALEGIQSVLKGKASSFEMDYTCRAPVELACFRMNVTPAPGGEARFLITHTDITDLQLSKENDCRRLQQLARRLIHAQESERQRIGREIHDDIGNRLALISLSVRQFMKRTPEGPTDAGVRELNKVVQDIVDLAGALRNLSHWLHSPTLRHLGIGPSLRALQELFERTYRIRVNMVVPPSLPRLPDEVELCVFRVSQECLQNIAKHSGADRVNIVLEHAPKQVRLTITDTGRGFDPSKAIREGGLGLLSMEERAQSLRGQLTVSSAPGAGTEVCLTIPMRSDAAALTAQ